MVNPFEEIDLGPFLAKVPLLGVVPQQTRYFDYIRPDDVEAVRAHRPDVLLRLGFRILQGPILEAPTYGVWSYHHGDNRVNRGGPAGVWESLTGSDVTGSTLQIITAELDAGRAIQRGTFATQRGSAAANRARMYWGSVPFVAGKLRDLIDLGPERALRSVDEGQLPTYSQPLFRTPTNGPMARLWLAQTARRLRGGLRARVCRTQWFLGYRFGPDQGAAPDLAPFRFRDLIPPRDRLWADPFPVSRDGRHFLLFEELIFGQRKGRISLLEVNSQGPVGPSQVVLEEDHHLSYPFVLHWQGEHYLIPEASASGKLTYYRAVDFPFRWERAGTLLDDAVVDATIEQIDGRWWMFASPRGTHLDSDALLLYSAMSPLGPWRPHRGNPVKYTALGSRPAGRLFQFEGRWHRPAQVCAPGYGRGIRLFRIERIDECTYSEREVGNLSPTWRAGVAGTHTINAHGGLTVIDMQRRVLRW